jgi:hypothetical protein
MPQLRGNEPILGLNRILRRYHSVLNYKYCATRIYHRTEEESGISRGRLSTNRGTPIQYGRRQHLVKVCIRAQMTKNFSNSPQENRRRTLCRKRYHAEGTTHRTMVANITRTRKSTFRDVTYVKG